MTRLPADDLPGWLDAAPRGVKRTGWFTIGDDLLRRPVSVGVGVASGAEPGPSILVIAGIHGDETLGVVAAGALFDDLQVDAMSGTAIVVPAANPLGLTSRSRYLHDRRDLNRAFPGTEQGSLARRTARLVTTHLLTRVDAIIDLHSASNYRYNITHGRVNRGDSASLELLEGSGLECVLENDPPEGSLRHAAMDRGLPTVVIESGEALRVDRNDAESCITAMLAVIRRMGILPQAMDPRATSDSARPQLLTSSQWLRAEDGGRIETLVRAGEWVAEGTELLTIHELLGPGNWAMVSPRAGYVLGIATGGLCATGDGLIHLGHAHPDESHHGTSLRPHRRRRPERRLR